MGDFIPTLILIIIFIALIFIILYQSRQHRTKGTSAGKALLIYLWLKWEKLFQKLFRVDHIDDEVKLLALRVTKYHGKPIKLNDGATIYNGDKVAELHLNNLMLYEISTKVRTPIQLAVMLIHYVDRDMPKLTKFIQEQPAYRNVKGLYGVSIINRGTKKFGFTVQELPQGIFYFFSRIYLRILLYILHPEGRKRLNTKKELLVPKTIAISKKELLKRFGNEEMDESEVGIKDSVEVNKGTKVNQETEA